MTGSSMASMSLVAAVDFVFVEVGDLLQHGVHGAGGFADADHLRHHVGKHAAFAQRIDDGAAFFDGLAHLHQRFFQHLVAGGPGGDAQTFENGHARGDQGAEGTGEAGHGDLTQQQAEDRQLQQAPVHVVGRALGVCAFA